MAIAATGYGLSLRLYLLAQRAFGAVRTGSVFAFAPLIAAAVAAPLGEREMNWWTAAAAAAALMILGLLLHLSESHELEHAHERPVS